LQEKTEKILLPRPEESVAIALHKEKIAALCYDRIWSPPARWRSPSTAIPDSIRFYCDTAPEQALLKNLYIKEPNIHKISQILEQFPYVEVKMLLFLVKWRIEFEKKSTPKLSVEQLTQEALNSLGDEERGNITSDSIDFIESIVSLTLNTPWLQQIDKNSLEKLIKEKKFEDVLKYSHGASYVQREITISINGCFGIHTVNIYESENARKNEFNEGDRRVIVATLEGLGLVDEFALTWDQVLDFRKDVNNRHKYVRFLHWLDKDMIGKSHAFIEDEISLRLEDYERSLKKHGIKTVIGTVSEVLDGKYILGSSGIAAGLSLSGHPVLGSLVGAGLLIGKIAVKVSETALSFDDKELGSNSEVSWVYEVKQLPKRHL